MDRPMSAFSTAQLIDLPAAVMRELAARIGIVASLVDLIWEQQRGDDRCDDWLTEVNDHGALQSALQSMEEPVDEEEVPVPESAGSLTLREPGDPAPGRPSAPVELISRMIISSFWALSTMYTALGSR